MSGCDVYRDQTWFVWVVMSVALIVVSARLLWEMYKND